MSSSEGGPKSPKPNQIEIYPTDKATVVGLKTLMNEEGLSLVQAVEKYRQDAKKSPADEHLYLNALSRAAEVINLQKQQKSKTEIGPVKGGNAFVVGLQTLMQEQGISLEQATRIAEVHIVDSEPYNSEHFQEKEALRKASEYLKSLEKK